MYLAWTKLSIHSLQYSLFLFEHAGIRLSTFMPGNVVWAKDKFSLVDETTAIKDRDKGRTSALCVCPYVLASEVSDHILRGGGGDKDMFDLAQEIQFYATVLQSLS
jgi:hypothetical protein